MCQLRTSGSIGLRLHNFSAFTIFGESSLRIRMYLFTSLELLPMATCNKTVKQSLRKLTPQLGSHFRSYTAIGKTVEKSQRL